MKKNNYPKNKLHAQSLQKNNGMDVEFSEILADANDKEAQARSEAANKRANKQK